MINTRAFVKASSGDAVRSGVELHDHVAAVAPELLDRIIFSTGDVASKDAAEFMQRTKCTVLQKPFELRALEGLIARSRQFTTA